MSWLRQHASERSAAARRSILAAVAVVAVGCELKLEDAPPDPVARGPTLETTIDGISSGDLVGTQLVAVRPLGERAQAAHAQFLVDTAGLRAGGGEGGDDAPEGPYVAATGIRVTLLPEATAVAGLEDAYSGLGVFVAPEDDPAARVVLGSVAAPTGGGPIALALVANQLDYEMAQAALGQSRFLVGVTGPTALRTDGDFRFELLVELDVAIVGQLDD